MKTSDLDEFTSPDAVAHDTSTTSPGKGTIENPKLPIDIVIRPYRQGDAAAFCWLNEQWITEYFWLEAQDLQFLRDPETHILARDGKIFFAVKDTEAVGCCALLALGSGVFEVARMTVRADYRGRGVGRALLLHVIEAARALGAKKLVLETSEKLASAVHLYQSLGFKCTVRDSLIASALERADVFMELALTDG